jgi:aspartate 1-decarboxylase
VDVVDINNGSRLTTYVIEGPPGIGVIGINGAAARLISPGDLVIIIAYASVTDAEAKELRPHVVFVDGQNRIRRLGSDPAEALPGSGTRSGAVDTASHRSPASAVLPR